VNRKSVMWPSQSFRIFSGGFGLCLLPGSSVVAVLADMCTHSQAFEAFDFILFFFDGYALFFGFFLPGYMFFIIFFFLGSWFWSTFNLSDLRWGLCVQMKLFFRTSYFRETSVACPRSVVLQVSLTPKI